MAPPTITRPAAVRHGLLWDLLTFDKLITGPVVHLIYWAGLGVIALIGFGSIGAAIGLALRDRNLMSILLAIPTLIAGLLVAAALGLLWRGACEFYVAVFRISDDLRAMRLIDEAERGGPPPGT
jgi:hypothetical protein